MIYASAARILFLVALFAASASQAYAITLQVMEICDERIHSQGELQGNGIDAGTLTVNFLTSAVIPFIGERRGINSILVTPTGDDAIELISDVSMRVYGWCYDVDGQIPELMPHEFVMTKESQIIRWFYAYSEYQSGKWLNYCEPVFRLKPEFACQTPQISPSDSRSLN
jgi:hypothetical protein